MTTPETRIVVENIINEAAQELSAGNSSTSGVQAVVATVSELEPLISNVVDDPDSLKDPETIKQVAQALQKQLALNGLMDAQEVNQYASTKSLSHGVISTSNMALYIGIIVNINSYHWAIVGLAIGALLISTLSLVITGYLYTLPPQKPKSDTETARFSRIARTMNGVIAALSPLVLIANIAISSLLGNTSLGIAPATKNN